MSEQKHSDPVGPNNLDHRGKVNPANSINQRHLLRGYLLWFEERHLTLSL